MGTDARGPILSLISYFFEMERWMMRIRFKQRKVFVGEILNGLRKFVV